MKDATQRRERQPHASLDVESRRRKAMKIEQMLGLLPASRRIRLLEIGTGSGVIANYFGTHQGISFDVSAVDVVDQRVMTDGFDFALVDGSSLPYDDSSFDVVLSNHVIEHVGSPEEQLRHLQEVGRVMAQGALGYLATPNRWAVVEPHFRLPFLSWFPRGWRDPYVRATRRGDSYDCEPLSPRELDTFLGRAGLSFTHIETEALSSAVNIGEVSHRIAWLLEGIVSTPISRLMSSVSPTLVCRLG